jgi:hypothetical protein
MSEHENAFDHFVSTIQEDLLIHKKVFYLNHLLEKFVPFLPEDMREIYTTYRLQQKLEKHFGDAIVIQCQQGQSMSNIVYSSSICLSEAIDKANRLKADMKSIRTHDLSDAFLDTEQIYTVCIFFTTSGFRKVPAKYKVCPTGKRLSALTNFETNSPRKLINSCLFLLIDKNF